MAEARTKARRLPVLGGLAAIAVATAVAAPAGSAAAPTNGLVGARNAVSISSGPASAARFDGEFSFAAAGLEAIGLTPGATVRPSDITYVWPTSKSGQNDSLQPDGRTVAVVAERGARTLGLLATSHNGPVALNLRLQYAACDGTTSTVPASATVPDWWVASDTLNNGGSPRPGALVSPLMQVANAAPVSNPVGVYEVKLPLDTAKQLVGVTVDGPSNVRLFDVQAPAPAAPVGC